MIDFPFCCDTIGDFADNTGRFTVDTAMREALADFEAHGSDGKPREVEIRVVLQQGADGTAQTSVTAQARLHEGQP